MRYSKPLYGILGIYIPFSVLALWSSVPGIICRHFVPADFSFIANEKLWCLAGFLSALAASCYAGVIKKSMLNHSAPDIRGSILAAAAAYALLSFPRRNLPLPERFLPSVDSVAASIAALFTWFSVISLREIFSGLELFESFASGSRGEQLRERMREYSPEMSLTYRRLKGLMSSYGIQFIPPCLLLTAAGFSRVSLPLTVFTLSAFSAGFLLLGFMRLLRRELACASEGVSLSVRDRSLPLPVMALGTGISALLALAASSDESLLPPGIILGFFSWLVKLLSSLFRPADTEAAPPLPDTGGMIFPQNPAGLFPGMETALPWPGWKWIKAGAVVFAAFLFLLFMVYPLLRRRGFFPKIGKIRAAVIRWFGDLKKGVSGFFAALRDRGASLKIKKEDREKLRRIASDLLAGGIRRKEVKRSVNLFARLIFWGIETAGVQWKPSFAPGEYCGLLAAAAADFREQIIRSGELFEKAVYSGRSLSAAEEQDFKKAVQSVTGNE